MKAKDAAAELVTLPLFPLFDHVLLPGGFVRVLIPQAWRKSATLVQHLLQQQGGEVYVAAVPYSAAKGSVATEEELQDDHLDLDRLHHVGTAARVLQLLKRTQNGGWAVTLEGRCRVRVRDVSLSSLQEMLVAAVEQLDYLGAVAGPFRGSGGVGGKKGGSAVGVGAGEEAGLATKEQEELVQELLQGTRQLFMLLQGGAEGRESGARVSKMLQSQDPARVADILGALVARDPRDHLALLSTTDPTRRLEMARDLMLKLLAAAAKAAGGGEGASRGPVPLAGAGAARVRRAGLPRAFRLSDLGGDAGGEEGDEEDGKEELKALLKKLQEGNPPPEVLRVALREYKRLSRGSEQHPGYAMSLAYLETLAELPWDKRSRHLALPAQQAAAAGDGEEGGREGAGEGGAAGGELSLRQVRQRLDEAHYGLDKIKDRIVQYVAVQRLRGWDARAPILCFIGPPGVGKTSLARCVGDVLGRPFQRISLGGVRDEAEIRGHRRTYIGAMPGRVIQAIRRAGVRDPVLLLDEVDKMGRDARGDPAAALLEVLDPEQNHAFGDTYLGVPFDLSSVVFVSTANRAADIPPPLLDRLEVVNLGGYTLDEKLHIAERHLVPRVLAEHGLLPGQLTFPRGALRGLVEGYTREAGVRTLARCLAAVCRHVAVQVVTEREGGAPGAPAPAEREQQLGEQLPGLPTADLQQQQPMLQGLPAVPAALAGGRAAAMPLAAGAGGVAAFGSGRSSQEGRVRLRGTATPAAAGSGLPAVAQHAGKVGDGASTLQLWEQLSSLAPLPAQQAQRGRAPRGGRTTAAAAQASAGSGTALGGYPWQQLQPLQRSPRGSPKAQQGGGGGWFSWLPWGATAGRHGEEGEEERGKGTLAQQAELGMQLLRRGPAPMHAAALGVGWDAPAPAAWGGCHPAERSMSLAGSMHSMPGQHVAPAAARSSRAGPQGPSQEASGEGQEGWPRVPATLILPVSGEGDEAGQEGLGRGQRGINPLRQVVVDEALLEEVLGPRRFTGHDNSERVASPGTAAGLVWTAVGGQVQYIECLCVGTSRGEGTGSLTLTGQLGDVLEESARIALSWVRAHAEALGLPLGSPCPATSWDVHIHLPSGAVPKDGPSAGVTLATVLVSLFTGRCLRADTAMTGELTLRGLVLPVGGIKEKLLAAHTAGMSRVIVPARNMRDVQADVPQEVRQALEILPAERLEDVLRHAFDPPLDLAAPPRARL